MSDRKIPLNVAIKASLIERIEAARKPTYRSRAVWVEEAISAALAAQEPNQEQETTG